MPPQNPPSERGEIIPIEFGGKIIAAKRKCTCGGDVAFKPNPQGSGRLAECTLCGATLAFGGSPSE